jgi:predicted RNase H-like HicB family nuclease
MIYQLAVNVTKLREGGYLAHCEEVRASATGDTSEEAMHHLRESIEEMIKEYGQDAVFQDVTPETEVQVIEVAV